MKVRCMDCKQWNSTNQVCHRTTIGGEILAKHFNGGYLEEPYKIHTQPDFGCVLFEEQQHSVERTPSSIPLSTLEEQSKKFWAGDGWTPSEMSQIRKSAENTAAEIAAVHGLLKQQDNYKQARREAAQAAMIGLLNHTYAGPDGLAFNAVQLADALLRRLEEP